MCVLNVLTFAPNLQRNSSNKSLLLANCFRTLCFWGTALAAVLCGKFGHLLRKVNAFQTFQVETLHKLPADLMVLSAESFENELPNRGEPNEQLSSIELFEECLLISKSYVALLIRFSIGASKWNFRLISLNCNFIMAGKCFWHQKILLLSNNQIHN